MLDTHIHLDDSQFAPDLPEVIARAKAAGIDTMLVPSVNEGSLPQVLDICRRFPGYAYPMIGLHPEDVRDDHPEVLARMAAAAPWPDLVAVGEVGLDFYFTREYEKQQLEAFATQIEWSIERHLPLMLHVRKAQNEAVRLLRAYRRDLTCGGVFHCFSGNPHEAAELLDFDGFALGIGGILTFKKSTLPDTLRQSVPLDRIVLETDAPYLAPVPVRGQRNESAFIPHIARMLAELYATDIATVDAVTTSTARKIFRLSPPQ